MTLFLLFKIKEQGALKESLPTPKTLPENTGLQLDEGNSKSPNLPKHRIHCKIRCRPWHAPALYSVRQALQEPKMGLGTVT